MLRLEYDKDIRKLFCDDSEVFCERCKSVDSSTYYFSEYDKKLYCRSCLSTPNASIAGTKLRSFQFIKIDQIITKKKEKPKEKPENV